MKKTKAKTEPCISCPTNNAAEVFQAARPWAWYAGRKDDAMKYNVSFVRNDVAQANLAIADSDMAVMAWFKMYKPDARVLSVSPATPCDEKPGKPCIEIPVNYFPHMNAADNMSLILQREKGMTCRFYVMDKGYYRNLACPQLSCDNRGHALAVGDWYVIITCSNGYKYYVNVTCDSVVTMCAEVFGFVQYK